MWRHVILLLVLAIHLQGTFAQKAEDYKVVSLPGIDINTLNFTQYAGHIEVSPATNANLFFWMLEQVDRTQGEKLIIWLNGGPGCSSMDGLFLENGPYRVNPDLSLSISPGGWQDRATIVYLDQPVGTGFSFAETNSYMRNLTQISEEFTTFLDMLFDIFPQLRSQDMYIAGESFAGTYIPYIASRLITLNKEHNAQYNLKGIAIGNGWISPLHQYNAYYDFAVNHNLLSGSYMTLATEHMSICRDLLHRKEKTSLSQCEAMMQDILDSSVHEENGRKLCMNQYDIRMKNEDMPACGQSWPNEMADIAEYLRLPELVSAAHATKQTLGWRECTRTVLNELADDDSLPAYSLLPSLLEQIPILLYSGEYDLICNTLGTEYLIGNMTWNGQQGLANTKAQSWTIDEKHAGYYTEARNLTYVVIKDGSHMVPYDHPIETLDMINRFMGVDNNQVNGLPSRVGQLEEKKPPADDTETETPDDTHSSPQYEHWGTYALVALLLVAAIGGFCWYRSRQPQRREDVQGVSSRNSGLLGRLRHALGFGNGPQGRKLRLDDQDDANELDELVVDNPTLFVAEESDDDSGERGPRNSKEAQAGQFAIVDDEDEEDFEDWDSIEDIRKKKKGD